MDVAVLAAIVYGVGTAGVVAFQIALALGAPWGAFAMGGALPGRLPPAMRVAALAQAGLLGSLAVVVLSRAGVAWPSLAAAVPWLIWVVVAIAAITVVLNLISRSAGERRIWVPVGLVLLVSSVTVALTAR